MVKIDNLKSTDFIFCMCTLFRITMPVESPMSPSYKTYWESSVYCKNRKYQISQPEVHPHPCVFQHSSANVGVTFGHEEFLGRTL